MLKVTFTFKVEVKYPKCILIFIDYLCFKTFKKGIEVKIEFQEKNLQKSGF